MSTYLTEEQVQQIIKSSREVIKELGYMSADELIERLSKATININDIMDDADKIVELIKSKF